MVKVKYNTAKFPFAPLLNKLFNSDSLSEINEDREIFSRERDQSTQFHKLYYKWARTDEFIGLYDKFILNVIKPLYNEKIVYQSIPTFRICYPNNIAVGEFHKDKYYRDVNWAEQVKEDNFFLPFTKAFDTNTVWVESEEDKGDYAPIECNYGELVQWDGSNLAHGNKVNKTGKCRVSVDFRVMKYSNYIPSNHGSINTQTKFQIGDYYKTI